MLVACLGCGGVRSVIKYAYPELNFAGYFEHAGGPVPVDAIRRFQVAQQ